jgi:GNAT superfamily N-acetyltransferase
MQIRPATPNDAVDLLELIYQHAEFEQASKPSIAIDKLTTMLVDDSNIQIWIAIKNKTLLGYFSLTQDYSTWSGEKYLHLDCLFLNQAHRKQGIGALLFEKVLFIAKSMGIKQIQWQTPIENLSGINFYLRQGAGYKIKSRFVLQL